jgi:hypothetical protein
MLIIQQEHIARLQPGDVAVGHSHFNGFTTL